ncbi:MAG: flagellar basal body-associated FliL family protein [Armatimonadota bacterium]
MRVVSGRAGKLPILVVVILVFAMLAGIGAVAFTRMGKAKHGKASVEEVQLSQWKLEEFVVNLADVGEPHYLKVDIVLAVAGEAQKGGGHGEGGGNPDEVAARDCIISVLTRKRYAQLLSADGKERLKKELKTELQNTLKHLKIAQVYFTSFAMQ